VALVRSRKRGGLYLFVLTLFAFYLIALLDIMFFPIPLPENWPKNLSWYDTARALTDINLIPFNFGVNSKTFTSFENALGDIVINVLLTIPFGLGICYLLPLRAKQVIFLILATGLALEGFQLLGKLSLGVHYHSVDINDVLMNSLGALLGYILYRFINWLFKKQHAAQKKNNLIF
jgi:glycopeptide antibiotics resistance protein